MRFKAKKIHGIVEALTFLSITITCIVLILRTSISQESLSKSSTCIGAGTAKGLINFIFDIDSDDTGDFIQFSHGNEEFNRRTFEHILKNLLYSRKPSLQFTKHSESR